VPLNIIKVPARFLVLMLLASAVFLSISSSSFADTVAPTAPEGFTATAVPGEKVMLSWKAASDNVGINGYNVYRRPSAGSSFSKLNSSPVGALAYEDKTATAGKNYDYAVRAVDAAGNESADSDFASAPSVVMSERAVIRHMGEIVDAAVPGDSIEYIIDYTNNGYGFANDVNILHAIPDGTVLLPNSVKVSKGSPASVLYYDETKGAWADSYGSEEDVTKVKFVLSDPIPSVSKGPNGQLSLKVVVSY